ncbi:hypothetical protein FRC16_004345 [Serendipita sp. 398]|nr:hypothetical protein FRC16_004345 [Serendipita sp. 398]
MACTGDASDLADIVVFGLGSVGFAEDQTIFSSITKPDPPTTTTYTGVIEVHDSASNDLLGYITKDTQNGISKYSTDLNNAEMFTFEGALLDRRRSR